MKRYIPYFVDSHLMECRIVWEKIPDSTALTLSGAVALIFAGADDSAWVFQSVDCENGFINNEYPAELLQMFEGWICFDHGEIIIAEYRLEDIEEDLKNFQVGFTRSGLCIIPATKELIKQIKLSSVGYDLKFERSKIEDLDLLKHIGA